MKIAVAIMIVALVAQAQGISCYGCSDALVLGKSSQGPDTCSSESIMECSPEQDTCLSVLTTWITVVDGTTMEDYMYIYNCGVLAVATKEFRAAQCERFQKDLDTTYNDRGFDKFECRVELCQDDLCNSDARVSDHGDDGDDGDDKHGSYSGTTLLSRSAVIVTALLMAVFF